jgi:hypothetical protein
LPDVGVELLADALVFPPPPPQPIAISNKMAEMNRRKFFKVETPGDRFGRANG